MPSSSPERAHLVLEELAQRLDQLELHALGQPADVVVALDRPRDGPLDDTRLDHVGIERALHEEARPPPSASRPRSSNTSMNSSPMILRFCSGSVDAARAPSRKRSRRVDRRAGRAGSARGTIATTCVALRPAAAGRCRRRCRSAGRRSRGASSAAATDESTPPESPQIDAAVRRPGAAIARRPPRRRTRPCVQSARHAADAEQEVAQDLAAARRVRDLGVELHAVDRRAASAHGGERRVRVRAERRRSPGGSARRGRRGSSTRRSVAARCPPNSRLVALRRVTLGAAVLALLARARPCRRAAAPAAARRSRCRGPARRGRRRSASTRGRARRRTRETGRPRGRCPRAASARIRVDAAGRTGWISQ